MTNGVITSVTEMVKQFIHVPDNLFDANPHILTLNDKCLDLITGKPVGHAPEYFATAKLPFNYDPKAQSTSWDRFLESCPHPEFLQEFAGYCLTPQTKHELAVWLWGPPGGGKSTFITGLEAMLGPKCCTLGLSEIERSNFALSQLPGKTLAISAEQPTHYVKSPHVINAIISGEPVIVDRKFRDAMQIIPRAKLLWAMNDLPRVDVGGQGIFRRVVPVEWPALLESQRDPELKEDIARSGMAVVNWAIGGLRRLENRGRFELPPALKAARELYRTHNDVTQGFVTEGCYQHPDAEVKAGELYTEYSRWCVKNGHRPLASNRFSAEISRLGFIKKERNIGNFWIGLELKNDNFDVDVLD